MPVHSRDDLKRLSRLARREFSHALMSDSKWRKLLAAMDEAGLAPQRILVKFIDGSAPVAMGWPGTATQHPPRPWVDSAVGPIELRAIEWLLIPFAFQVARGATNVPPRDVRQDVDGIETLLAALGRFPLERSAEGLRVVGYRR